MRALVTGATGFIGSHLAEGLLRKGAKVRALARSADRLRWLKEIEDVEVVFGSLEDSESLMRAVDDVDVVYHAAGIVKARSAAEFFNVNTRGTENILQAVMASKGTPPRFVFVSSQAAVGPSRLDEAMDESAPANPITPYGRSKLKAEEAVLALKDRIPVILIRPPAVYGPREADLYMFFKLASRGVVPIPGFGDRMVSLTYVEDLVQGIILAGTQPEALGKTFFITSGDYDWRELASTLAAVIGRGRIIRLPLTALHMGAIFYEVAALFTRKAPALSRDKARELGQRAWLCSDRRAREVLGYRPAWPLKKGLSATAAWYREAGWI